MNLKKKRDFHMKKVKQISLDVVVDENVDGEVLAEKVAEILEENGYRVVGAGFREDMTDTYQSQYPDLL